MLRIDIDNSAMERAIAVTEATDKQVAAARSSALRKIMTPIKTDVKREVSRKLRVPQNALERRMYVDPIRYGDDTATLWIGAWALSPFNIGHPAQYGIPGKTGGVVVGSHDYPGAFLATIYTSNEKIWIRKSSKHYDPDLYPTKYRSGDRGISDTGGRGRFPVVRAAFKIDDIVKQVLEDNSETYRQKFLELFAHELNYQVNIKGNA